MRTAEDYRAALKSKKQKLYADGERVDDVTSHPRYRKVLASHALHYTLAHNPEHSSLLTTKSYLSDKTIYRWSSLTKTMEDVINYARLKRFGYENTGTCVSATCVGFCAFNSLWHATWKMDRELGTNYHERLKNYILTAEAEGYMIAGGLTDAKGNRRLKASEQAEKDTFIRIVDRKPDGIVVRGIKCMVAGAVAADEIFIMPGAGYREDEKEYAVACVIPRNIEGLTMIENRRVNDVRDLEDGWDNPVPYANNAAYLILDNVYVPNERVFMAGEAKYSMDFISYYTANYRSTQGGCVAGQGSIMVGAAVNIARANGLSSNVMRDKLMQMVLNNETTWSMGIGAIAMGKLLPSGVWMSDPLLAHSTKVQIATLPYETKRLCQEVAGGIAETGCFPSSRDFPMVEKYFAAGSTGRARARTARLIEWLTVGSGIPGCLHGGGSPDGARLVMRASYPFEAFAKKAAELAGVTDEIAEPPKK